MSEAPQDLQRLVPGKLTATFSRSRIRHCLLIAVAAHLVLLVATSVVYVRDTWIDPEGAARRKAAKKADGEAAAPKSLTGAARTAHEAEMEKRKDAPVIKDIAAKANKDEIPKEPDGLGITIDETNP